jgi:trk system potassium uptake protein TrkA
VISPQFITSSTILRYVRARENSKGTKIERLYRLVGGKAEAIEFVARKGDAYIGIPLKKLKTRTGTLVSLIVRQGQIIVPFGNDHIEEEDHVVIISVVSGISDLNEVLYQ